MPRKRLSQEHKAQWVRRFRRQNQSAAAFCRENGLRYASFLQWKRSNSTVSELAPKVPARAKFVEIEVQPSAKAIAPATSAREERPLAELTISPGVVLRVYSPTTRSARP